MVERDSGMETEMNRGFLQILTLLILETSMYGYQMVRIIAQLGYTVEENTLYPLLRRLEKNGWIESRWEIEQERPKKYYVITSEGRKVRSRFLKIWDNQRRIIANLIQETHP